MDSRFKYDVVLRVKAIDQEDAKGIVEDSIREDFFLETEVIKCSPVKTSEEKKGEELKLAALISIENIVSTYEQDQDFNSDDAMREVTDAIRVMNSQRRELE